MTPAEKAAATRQDKITWALFEALKALPDGSTPADVVRVFEGAKATPRQLGNAFTELDDKPGRFSGASYFPWHSKLRQCRNHPVHGPALFALFR